MLLRNDWPVFTVELHEFAQTDGQAPRGKGWTLFAITTPAPVHANPGEFASGPACVYHWARDRDKKEIQPVQ